MKQREAEGRRNDELREEIIAKEVKARGNFRDSNHLETSLNIRSSYRISSLFKAHKL
jgi:hypothetical protein